MNFEITEHEFFRSPGYHTLRFTTHVPPVDHGKDPHECGCTKNAETRPEGTPDHVQRIVKAWQMVGDTTVVYDSFFQGFCIYPNPPVDIVHDGNDAHAYLWVDENQVQVEVVERDSMTGETLPGTYLMCMLYVGRPSAKHAPTLFNGHSPTQLDLSGLASNSVWLHEGFFEEAMAVLDPEGVEAATWRDFVVRATWIQAQMVAQKGESPEAHHARLGHEVLLSRVLSHWGCWAAKYLYDPTTELRKRGDQIKHSLNAGPSFGSPHAKGSL